MDQVWTDVANGLRFALSGDSEELSECTNSLMLDWVADENTPSQPMGVLAMALFGVFGTLAVPYVESKSPWLLWEQIADTIWMTLSTEAQIIMCLCAMRDSEKDPFAAHWLKVLRKHASERESETLDRADAIYRSCRPSTK